MSERPSVVSREARELADRLLRSKVHMIALCRLVGEMRGAGELLELSSELVELAARMKVRLQILEE